MTTNNSFPYISNFDLPEYGFIANSDQTLGFEVVNINNNIINISSAESITWYLSNFGSASSVLTLSGVYTGSGSATNTFSVSISASSTAGLTGEKFVHQYEIVDFNGVTLRPSQGILNIVKAIQ